MAACGDGARGKATLAGATMGTTYSVTLTDPPGWLNQRTLTAEIDSILETVNHQMSNWRADSELSVFNAGPAQVWKRISADTLDVIDEALRVGHLSDGAFDPTTSPLIDLWGFGPGPTDAGIPTDAELEAALGRVDFRRIRIGASPKAVWKASADLGLNLSGIAKGFGVDKVALHLQDRGIENYLVELGGELRGEGLSPRGRPWRIGIEKPLVQQRSVQRVISLDTGAIATSGNHRNFFEAAGSRYSHIIDPRSGEPVRHELASVSVVAQSAMRADALSTALMVLGPDAGVSLARQQNIAAFFVLKDGAQLVEVSTSAFDRYKLG